MCKSVQTIWILQNMHRWNRVFELDWQVWLKRDFDRGRNFPSNSKQCRLYDMYFTPQQNIEATFAFENKKSIYVTKSYKQSPRYWPQQLCWVTRTSTKQEKEEKVPDFCPEMMYMLYTNIMELYFQLKHVSSNFETRYMYEKHIYMYNCTWRWPNLFEHLNLINADGNQCRMLCPSAT